MTYLCYIYQQNILTFVVTGFFNMKSGNIEDFLNYLGESVDDVALDPRACYW